MTTVPESGETEITRPEMEVSSLVIAFEVAFSVMISLPSYNRSIQL